MTNLFPWRKYKKKELLKEYEKLKLKLKLKLIDINFLKQPINYFRQGMKCTNHFFQKVRLKTKIHSTIDCYNFYFKWEKRIKEYNSKRISPNLFATTVFLSHAPAHFPIVTAGIIYKIFNAKKIFDPYAGWGDRCLAAMALNLDYIGIDCNTKLKNCYNRMIKSFILPESKINIIYDRCENIDINNLDFDFVFTSPPFWTDKNKLLEEYYNTEIDLDKFLNKSLIPIIKKIKNKNSNTIICLYIPDNMYNIIKKQIKFEFKFIKFRNCNKYNKFKKIYYF